MRVIKASWSHKSKIRSSSSSFENEVENRSEVNWSQSDDYFFQFLTTKYSEPQHSIWLYNKKAKEILPDSD